MFKIYKFFFIPFLLFSFFLFCSKEKVFYEDQIASLKIELIELQKQKNNLLITLKQEIEKSKKSSSSLWIVLNPVFILFVANFIKNPSLENFLLFLPYLYIILPKSFSQSNKMATSLIELESMIKQKKEKIKKLKSKDYELSKN